MRSLLSTYHRAALASQLAARSIAWMQTPIASTRGGIRAAARNIWRAASARKPQQRISCAANSRVICRRTENGLYLF